MLFNVPQYIDVEDKVAGPLTARQLLWMIGMGAALMFLWSIFDTGGFFVSAIPVVCAFVALAFYRPYNQPLITFIGHAIMFVVRPKVYVWERYVKASPQKERPKEPEAKIISISKTVTADEISRLAKIVNTQK